MLEVDSAGNAFCVWLETVSGPNGEFDQPEFWVGVNIWLSALASGGEWNQPEIIKSGEFYHYPFLAMEGTGRAIVCWQEQDGVYAKLYR
jgi:hypothetical protein